MRHGGLQVLLARGLCCCYVGAQVGAIGKPSLDGLDKRTREKQMEVVGMVPCTCMEHMCVRKWWGEALRGR